MAITKEQIAAALRVVKLLADAIKEAGEIPSGNLYREQSNMENLKQEVQNLLERLQVRSNKKHLESLALGQSDFMKGLKIGQSIAYAMTQEDLEYTIRLSNEKYYGQFGKEFPALAHDALADAWTDISRANSEDGN